MGRIYAGVTEVIDHDHKYAITLKNYGNLPAMFHWEEKIESDRIIARFEPARGSIAPNSEVHIYFSATVYVGGNINELFICNIDDLEIPLGFELHADAFGLNVSYETTDDTVAALNMSGTATSFNPNKSHASAFSGADDYQSVSQKSSVAGSGGAMAKLQKELLGNQLKMLTFPTCKINKTST